MIDSFGREISYLRLSVTELCNLRCRYCMPEEGICKKDHSQMMTEEEMVLAVKAAASLGIRKLRITGGEPLVKKNILSICEKTAAVKGIQEVCLTTNGILLPEMAKDLRRAGVRRVNISLDTLNPERYAYITRIGTLDQAMAGIEAALEAGFEKVKINTVLIGGFNETEIRDLAGMTCRYPLDVRFIELMPMSGSREFGEDAYLPGSVILERIPELIPESEDGGVARLYRMPKGKGCVGLISPVSAHFCGVCNRLRLTADGKIKPCLHSAAEYSVRGLDQAGMESQFLRAAEGKPAWHGELSAHCPSHAGRSMNQIGG